MKTGWIWTALALAILSTGFAQERVPISAPMQDAAGQHHQRGVEFHLKRCLDQASQEYASALEIEPPREATAAQIALARRFLPRLFTTRSEPFRLRDFAVILHPSRRLMAYHLFWEDDIDFPEDNDPCDHELLWVEYAEDQKTITGDQHVLSRTHSARRQPRRSRKPRPTEDDRASTSNGGSMDPCCWDGRSSRLLRTATTPRRNSTRWTGRLLCWTTIGELMRSFRRKVAAFWTIHLGRAGPGSSLEPGRISQTFPFR